MSNSANQDTCCQCGMEKANWTARRGHAKDGGIYCCERCAEETGCECEQALRQQRLLSKPIRRPAMRPGPSNARRPVRA
jgi:hypothetical protein